MNDAPNLSEGKAYRQSPDAGEFHDPQTGRVGRALLGLLVVLGLVALAVAGYAATRHTGWPRWVAPAAAGGGVVVALLSAVGLAASGRRRRGTTYRFDSSSSRALSTLGRMHSKR